MPRSRSAAYRAGRSPRGVTRRHPSAVSGAASSSAPLGENLHRTREPGAEGLLEHHVQVAERLELVRALERAGVDRTEAGVGDDPADGLLAIVGVGGDQDVERLVCDAAL